MAEQMANELRLPIVRIIEGSGGGGSVKTHRDHRTRQPARPARLVHHRLPISRRQPRHRAGGRARPRLGRRPRRRAARRQPLFGDDQGTSAMFVAGPPVVARAGQRPDQGGAGRLGDPVPRRRGRRTPSRPRTRPSRARGASCRTCRPRSTSGRAAHRVHRPTRARRDEKLFSVDPARPPQGLQDAPDHRGGVDKGSFFEIGRSMFGRSMITGLARLWRLARRGDGERSVSLRRRLDGGCLRQDRCASSTSPRPSTCRSCISCDCPGFLIGLEAEKAATIRHGVRAMAAINQSSVPWCTIIVRNVVRRGGAAHAPAGRLAIRYAWPSAWWGSLPLEGGIEAAYRAEIDAAADPKRQARRDRGAAQRAPLAVPDGRGVLGRGDHRSARHARAAVRVRGPRRAAAHARAAGVCDAALEWRAAHFTQRADAWQGGSHETDRPGPAGARGNLNSRLWRFGLPCHARERSGRRAGRPLLLGAVEEPAPARRRPPLRAEPGRCDLGLRRRVLGPRARVPARGRCRYCRSHRPAHGDVARHHDRAPRRRHCHRRRGVFGHRPARVAAAPAATGTRQPA